MAHVLTELPGGASVPVYVDRVVWVLPVVSVPAEEDVRTIVQRVVDGLKALDMRVTEETAQRP